MDTARATAAEEPNRSPHSKINDVFGAYTDPENYFHIFTFIGEGSCIFRGADFHKEIFIVRSVQPPPLIRGCLMIPLASVCALRDISYNPAKRSGNTAILSALRFFPPDSFSSVREKARKSVTRITKPPLCYLWFKHTTESIIYQILQLYFAENYYRAGMGMLYATLNRNNLFNPISNRENGGSTSWISCATAEKSSRGCCV